MNEMRERLTKVLKKIKSSDVKKTIGMVVDDDAVSRKLRERLFTLAGCDEVDLAKNGEEALEFVKQRIAKGEMYLIISCDYEMSLGSGWNGAQTFNEIVQCVAQLKEREKELSKRKTVLERQQNTDTSTNLHLRFFMEVCKPQLSMELKETKKALRLVQGMLNVWENTILWCVTTQPEEMYRETEALLKDAGQRSSIKLLQCTHKNGQHYTPHTVVKRGKKMSAPIRDSPKDELLDKDRRYSEPPCRPSF